MCFLWRQAHKIYLKPDFSCEEVVWCKPFLLRKDPLTKIRCSSHIRLKFRGVKREDFLIGALSNNDPAPLKEKEKSFLKEFLQVSYCELPLAFVRGFLLHRGDSLHRRYGPSQPCKKNIYKKTYYDVFGFHLIPSLAEGDFPPRN